MVVLSSDTSEGLSASDSPEGTPQLQPPQLNLQRHLVNTTVATVPIIINELVFEDGIIDTGATNTMISQSAARHLNLMDQIEPSRLRYSCADGKMSTPWGIIRKLPVAVEGLVIPIDVFVSGATSYDVLLGTDWLTQAHAEISFAKQEISFRIEPQIMGRVPITVMPASKSSNRYCVARLPELDLGGPAGPPAGLRVPEVPDLPDDNMNDGDDITGELEEEVDLNAASDEEMESTDQSEEEYSGDEEVFSSDSEVEIFNALVRDEGEELMFAAHSYLTEDWMLEVNVFKEIEAQWGPFDIDACCDAQGYNSQLPLYWSSETDCLMQNWTHMSVYCNPHFSLITSIVEHCFACFTASPFTTSAVLVLPWWPSAPWFPTVIEQFEIIRQFLPGVQLFTAPGEDPAGPRRRIGPTRWPVIIVRIPTSLRKEDPGMQRLR
eukprot:jgi/Botrbrau1/7537/Bobra.0019s0025.1